MKWETRALGDVCEIVMGQSPDGHTYNAKHDGVPLLNGPTEFGPQHPTAKQWTTAPTKFCLEGDILYCVRGATLGRMNVADQPYCMGRGLAAIRASTRADTGYVWFALRTVTAKVLEESAGSTFPSITGEKLASVAISLPPLPEQRRIAARLREQLAEVEKAREALQSQLEAAEKLASAAISEIMEHTHDGAWKAHALEECAHMSRGRFSPRPRNDPRFYGGEYPFIQTGDVATIDGVIKRHKQTLNEDGLRVSKLFKAGTLVISIAANIGSVGILGFDACMPDSLVGIEGLEGKADNRFLFYCLTTKRREIQAMAPQMAQANLSLALLRSVRIHLPSISDQLRIATTLDALRASNQILINEIRARLETVEKLPAALLWEVFNPATL